MKGRLLQIHPNDNLLVALSDLPKDMIIQHGAIELILKDDIHAKHKFNLTDLKAGDKVIMYGVVVGTVTEDLAAGTRISTLNTKHAASPYDYRGIEYKWQPSDVSRFKDRKFMGYLRD